MTKKTGIMIGAVLAIVAAVAVGGVVLTGGKSESYRSIMVYQVDGDATITRERVGEMDAYENLMLQSGDSVAVASDSSMRLKLDDDKYLLAEQNTLMNIVADGNDENAKTYIDLQKGSVTSEIQNKLKDGASYEVNTPNSIMAVRGTIFRVEVEPKENGDTETKLTVFQGTVGVKRVLPDGTILDTEVKVDAGKELTVDETDIASGTLKQLEDIDYDSLPPIITEYLEELIQSGKDLPANVTEHMQKAQGAEKAQLQDAQEPNPEQKEQAPEPEQQDKEEPQEPKEQEPEAPEKQPKKQSDTQDKPQDAQEQEPPQTQAPDMEQQDPNQKETQPQKADPQPKPQNPTPDQESEQKSEGGSKKKTQYYTVTFQYNGNTFGTQRVKKGQTATEPKLCPTPNGAWDYDFSQKVNKNIVVEWKAN